MPADDPNEPPIMQPMDSPQKLRVSDEPPIVVFEKGEGSSQEFPFLDPQIMGSFYDLLKEPAYGAQRVFDLFTLMAITLAFGLLFGAMKALGAMPEVFFGVTSFITFIGIGQMLLFGGNSPRLASIVGGPIALILTAILLNAWYGRFEFWPIFCSMVVGFPFGYLAGGMVAGVFFDR